MAWYSWSPGVGRARGSWLGAAAALFMISAQSAAYGGPLWGVVVTANGVTYDSATGGPGSGSSGTSSWSSPAAAGLTQAFVRGSDTYPIPCPPCIGTGTLGTEAGAGGILGSGSVLAYGFATESDPFLSYASASADAKIYDTVTFDAAGATSSTVTDIGISLFINHEVYDYPAYEQSVEKLQLGGGSIEYDFNSLTGPTSSSSGWVSGQFIELSRDWLQFSGTYEFQGPRATVPFSMEVSTFCHSSPAGYCSGLGGTLSLALPYWVTYTSASGAFLTAGTETVPEPSAWISILGGLGMVALGRTRKRR